MDRPDDRAQPERVQPAGTPAPAARAAPAATPTPEAAEAPKPTVTSPVAADPEDPSHALLHLPVNVRSASLMLLAALCTIATLKWGAPFFIPVMIGFLLSYALSPIVDRLQKWRIPRALSAGVLIFGLLFSAGAGVWSFSDDVNAMVESMPAAAVKLRDKLRQRTTGTGTLNTVQKAAAQLEQAAAEAGPAAPAQRGVQRVVVEKPRFDLREHLWTGTLGLASFIGQVVVVTFLTYFLLLSGDTFRRKLVKITGPELSTKKVTVQALDEINEQIQRYLLVQLVSSIIVGVATALAFWAIGLNHAGVWGFFGGLLNLIPYIGAIVITGAAGVVAFMQFGELDQAFYIVGASTVIHTIVGYLLVQLAASVFVGVASGIGFALAGLNHAAVWGLAAGVLNMIPYVGNAMVGACAALAGFVQAGELDLALTVAAISFAIDLPKGYLIVPWATSRASRMSPVAVFVGVLAWGWLWGVWGLLLGIPILMIVKAVCDRVDHLKPIGELLGQ
jgi:predicted PurR-regulated permease PerM